MGMSNVRKSAPMIDRDMKTPACEGPRTSDISVRRHKFVTLRPITGISCDWRTMRKTGLVILLALVTHAEMARAEGVREGPTVIWTHDTGIGERIDDLNFTDVDGKPGKL